jgi:predicted DNA-binding protein YlxM (UPF0122 family)
MHEPELIETVLHDYQNRLDLSVKEVADRHGVSVSALLAWAKKAYLPQRPHGRPRMEGPTARQRAIMELIAHRSLEDVARRFRVKKQEIWRIAERWKHLIKPRRAPYEAGDIIKCGQRTYTVYAADFFSGSLVDDKGRFIPRFAWKRCSLIEKIGHTAVDPSWYAKKKRSA